MGLTPSLRVIRLSHKSSGGLPSCNSWRHGTEFFLGVSTHENKTATSSQTRRQLYTWSHPGRTEVSTQGVITIFSRECDWPLSYTRLTQFDFPTPRFFNARCNIRSRFCKRSLPSGSQIRTYSTDYVLRHLTILIISVSRSQWPRGLRRRSLAARLLRLWVRIPLGAWMFVRCECCVLSGRGLCDGLIIRSEESYRM